jgi:hypothetical protein
MIKSLRKQTPILRLRGVAVRTKTIQSVEFVCPRCGVDREGAVVEQQRWYCVLGIPTVPLAVLEPAVVCNTCDHRAGLGVLDVLTSAALTECLATAMRYAVASIVRAGIDDGNGIGPDVLDEVFDVMLGSGYLYDELVLAGDLTAVDDNLVRRALEPLADELTPHGKQGFLHRMIAIAMADGHLNRNEQLALVNIGVGLGMAAPHINGVLASAIQFQPAA